MSELPAHFKVLYLSQWKRVNHYRNFIKGNSITYQEFFPAKSAISTCSGWNPKQPTTFSWSGADHKTPVCWDLDNSTTKLAHLNENLATADLQFSADEIHELDSAIAKITIHGDRYTAVEQERVDR